MQRHNRYVYSPTIEGKPFDWLTRKRPAPYIALNVEDFSFGEGPGRTPTTSGPPPDPRNFALRDYSLRVGIWRILELMERLNLPLCHLLNASIATLPATNSGIFCPMSIA